MTDWLDDGDRLMTVTQAARELALDPDLITAWAASGYIRWEIGADGVRRFPEASLRAAADRMRSPEPWPDLMTKAQVAAFLGVGPERVSRLRRDKVLVGQQDASGRWLYRREAVVALKAHRDAHPPRAISPERREAARARYLQKAGLA